MKTWNVNITTCIRTDRIFTVEAETEAEAKRVAQAYACSIAVEDSYETDDVFTQDLVVEEIES